MNGGHAIYKYKLQKYFLIQNDIFLIKKHKQTYRMFHERRNFLDIHKHPKKGIGKGMGQGDIIKGKKW